MNPRFKGILLLIVAAGILLITYVTEYDDQIIASFQQYAENAPEAQPAPALTQDQIMRESDYIKAAEDLAGSGLQTGSN